MGDFESFIKMINNQESTDTSYDKYEVEHNGETYIVRINECGFVFDSVSGRFQYMFNYKW